MIEELSDTVLEAINWGMMEIRFFKRAEGAEAEAMFDAARGQLARIWDRLEHELEQGPWLSGRQFGRVDAAVIIHVVNANFFGMPPLDRHAKLRDWVERASALESVKKDQAELMAFMAGDGMRGMRKGPLRRQYRDHRLEWMLRSGGVDVVLRGMKANTIQFSAFP
jgi:glutathione S-transferase/RNA polymerase-associated protein